MIGALGSNAGPAALTAAFAALAASASSRSFLACLVASTAASASGIPAAISFCFIFSAALAILFSRFSASSLRASSDVGICAVSSGFVACCLALSAASTAGSAIAGAFICALAAERSTIRPAAPNGAKSPT